jgi:predicted nucleic acid-binding protein
VKVFIDTNILIDFIARRDQYYHPAANLINLGIKGEIKLFATPLSYATCIFIAKKILGYEGVVKAMQILDNYIQITAMTASQCHNALYSNTPDFEDMLQFESAYGAGCDVIVTRNKKHFPQDAMQIVDSIEFFDNYWAEM